VIIKELVSLI